MIIHGCVIYTGLDIPVIVGVSVWFVLFEWKVVRLSVNSLVHEAGHEAKLDDVDVNFVSF